MQGTHGVCSLARKPHSWSFTIFAAALHFGRSSSTFGPATPVQSPHPSQISTPLFSALEAITGSAVSESQRLQSLLPVSNGGVGLPIASKLCHAAFLGSYVDTKPLAEQIINKSPQLAPGSVQNCVSALQGHEPTIQSIPVLSPLKLKPSSPTSSMARLKLA